MIPCVVFDFQTLGAFALAAILIATVYLIYRDIRMIMQMVNDLREEFMVLQLTCKPGCGATDDNEADLDADDDDDDDDDPCAEDHTLETNQDCEDPLTASGDWDADAEDVQDVEDE